MSDAWTPGLVGAALSGAALLFLLDCALSTALLAVNSLSRVAVRKLSQESEDRLRFLEELKAPQSTYRMATQVARQMALLGGSVLTGVAAHGAGWPHPWLLGVACGTVLGVLLLETLAARAVAQSDPRAVLRVLAPLVRLVRAATAPLLSPFAAITRRTVTAAPGENEDRDDEQEEELDALIEVGEREGILEADEGEMMRSIVDLDDTKVREIMTPRTDIIAFPAGSSVADVRRALVKASHSRFPVYRGTIDNVVGILHVRDLIRAWEEGREAAPVVTYVRPALFVPETQSVSELLAEMRQRTHVALVVDEYGGIAGLVTLEDLLEEIVGDIRDEHDEGEALVQQEPDGSWLVNGLAHVEQLEDLFDLEVGDEREFDTVGGLVIAALGRVPAEGETFDAHGLHIHVVRADPRRVYKVRVEKVEKKDKAGSVEAAS